MPLFSDPIKTHKWMVIRIESYSSILQRTSVGSDRLHCWTRGPRCEKKGIDSPWWDFWLVVVDTGQKKSVQEEETFFFSSSFLFQDSSKLYFWAAGFSLPPHFTVTFFLTQMWKKKKINLFLNFFLCVGCYSGEGDFKKEEETPERWLDIKRKKKKNAFPRCTCIVARRSF